MFQQKSVKSEVVFAMDYTSKEDEELFFATTPMKRMIKGITIMIMRTSHLSEYVEKEIRIQITQMMYIVAKTI